LDSNKIDYIITHTDLDGVVAGVVLYQGLFAQTGSMPVVKFVNYGETKEVLNQLLTVKETINRIYFTDITPESMAELEGFKPKTVVILDHHKSGLDQVDVTHEVIHSAVFDLDGKNSAAMVAFNYIRYMFTDDTLTFLELRNLAMIASDWDLRIHSDPLSKYFGMASYIMQPEKLFSLLTTTTLQNVIPIVKQVAEAAQTQFDRSNDLFNRTKKRSLIKYGVGDQERIFNLITGVCFGFSSMVCDQYTDKNVVIVYDLNDDRFHLRTKMDGINLREIAKTLSENGTGGGFTDKVAGCGNKNTTEILLTVIQEYIVISILHITGNNILNSTLRSAI